MNAINNNFAAALAFAGGGASIPTAVDGYAQNSRMFDTLPSHVYHADKETLSCSMLKHLLLSPAHFQESLLRSSTSKAMDFGSLVHALVLEPRTIGKDFAIYPGVADGRSTEYKDFEKANPDRLVIDEPTFRSARDLAEKTLSRRVFGRPFGDFVAEGKPEVSIYFEDPTTLTKLKIRLDLWHPEYSFDLKTTRHATTGAFVRDAISMNYDLQAFMYSFGRALFEGTEKPKPFVFIAAETDRPHSVHVIEAGATFVANGMAKYQHALGLYVGCTQTGFFPDASGELTAEIEPWNKFDPIAPWKDDVARY